MKAEAVELELSGSCWNGSVFDKKWSQIGRRQALQLAHFRVGPLQNHSRSLFFAQHAHTGFAHRGRIQPLGQQLNDDQRAVLVDDQAGQLVGLAEAEAAGVGAFVEQGLPPPDRRAQPVFEQLEPGGLVDGLARDHPERNLRTGAVERRSQQQPTAIGHGQQRGRVAGGQFDRFNVGGVDPQMAGTQPVGGAAADLGAGNPGFGGRGWVFGGSENLSTGGAGFLGPGFYGPGSRSPGSRSPGTRGLGCGGLGAGKLRFGKGAIGSGRLACRTRSWPGILSILRPRGARFLVNPFIRRRRPGGFSGFGGRGGSSSARLGHKLPWSGSSEKKPELQFPFEFHARRVSCTAALFWRWRRREGSGFGIYLILP